MSLWPLKNRVYPVTQSMSRDSDLFMQDGSAINERHPTGRSIKVGDEPCGNVFCRTSRKSESFALATFGAILGEVAELA